MTSYFAATEEAEEAYWAVKEELVRLAAPTADRIRDLLREAMERGDVETIRSEGHHWSGHIALAIFTLADRLEASMDIGRKEGFQ